MSRLIFVVTVTVLLTFNSFAHAKGIELFQIPGKVDIREMIRKGIIGNLRTSLSYTQARRYLFGELHLQRDQKSGEYFIRDSYCGKKFTANEGVGPNRIPRANLINTEHTWPQSHFNRSRDTNSQKVDLHHLFPTDSRANSVRSNNILGEVDHDSERVDDCTASRIGYTSGSGEVAFQPPGWHRGDAARAVFYFATRYSLEIPDEEEMYLRKWNHEDPPSPFEVWRNRRIRQIQGNSNPYVEDSSLVNQIGNF